MLHLANLKVFVALKQQSETNGGTLTSDIIDTQGHDYVKIIVHGTTSNNATNNPSTLKVQQSDTTDSTAFADIAALVGDGASGFTIPNSPTATTNSPLAILNVNMNGKKRYLRVLVAMLTTQTYSAVALLGRSEVRPTGTSAENAAVVHYG